MGRLEVQECFLEDFGFQEDKVEPEQMEPEEPEEAVLAVVLEKVELGA